MLCEFVRIREGQLTLPDKFCNAVNDIIFVSCAQTRPAGVFIFYFLCVYFLYDSIIK